MAAVELDPVFVRALRLLHSKSKDSTSQLKSMLDEAIRHRKGLGPGPTGFSPVSPQRKREAPPLTTSAAVPPRKDAEKRSLDKLKHELSELVPSKSSFEAALGGGKRPRLDSPRSSSAGFSSKSHTPSPTPPGSRGESADKHNSSSGGNSSEAEAEESLELDMNLEGLNDCTCCVCKSFNQESGNKLMECHTCQNLFHQGCHEPPVPNDEANDPRLVWNCTECSKKQPSYKPATMVKGHTGLNVLKATPSGSSSSRASPSKSDLSASSSFFKKDKGIGSGKPTGMSALAASYKSGNGSGKSSSSSRSSRSSSSSSSSSSKTLPGSSSSSGPMSGMSADKRIQMMKKKAAAARKMK